MPDATHPALANRTSDLAQSDIRAVTQLINEHGGINLGQGICDLPTPEPVKRGAKAAIDANKSIYTSYAGIGALREEILAKAQSYNNLPASSPSEVMVSAGSTGAFVTALLALLNPGDELLLFEPFYGYHRNLARALGIELTYVSTRPPDWAIDFKEVEAAIGPKTKAVVVNTPSNPSGKVWSRQELQNLLKIMERHDLFAITDEIYEYMLYDEREHVSLAALPGAYERTVTLSGLSKTYNMTGWRMGYAIAPSPIIEQMGLLNDLIYICAPTPLQHGSVEAFRMDASYLTELRQDYAERRQLLGEALEQAGFGVPWPQGAYYIFASFEELSNKRSGFEDDHAACRTLIKEAGVASVPGHSFFSNPADGRYLLRFCFAKERSVLQQACSQLVDALG